MPSPRITVIGSSNIDLIMAVPRLPAAGETVTDGRFARAFGGKGANQAVAAARAGGDAAFVTCLGGDAYAAEMTQSFVDDGIDTRFVYRSAEYDTGTALILIDAAGRNCIAVAPGANDELSPGHVEAARGVIAESAAVVLQNETPAAAIETALEIAAAEGVRAVFNYAPVRGAPVSLDARIGVLVVNENEAAELAGIDRVDQSNAQSAAQALLGRGPASVVLTLGGDGVVVVDADGSARLDAHRVEPADTTAAGDTFCGVLAVALGEGRPLRDAAVLANAAAALSVTCRGAQPSIPRRAEIDAFLRRQSSA